jgi:hypothetical protein
MGIDFQADLVVLTSSGIDVILGMDWLGKCDGIILWAKKSVLITSPQGDRIEVVSTTPSKEEGKADQDKGKYVKDLRLSEEHSVQDGLRIISLVLFNLSESRDEILFKLVDL